MRIFMFRPAADAKRSLDPAVLDKLAAELKARSITPAENKETFFTGFSYIISNDNFRVNQVGRILKSTPKIAGHWNIGLVFGESHLLSYLPELSFCVDFIISFDINPTLHQHLGLMLSLLSQCDTRHEFLKKYKESLAAVFNLSRDKVDAAVIDLMNSKLIEPDHFFLGNQRRYQQCRENVSRVRVLFYQANFYNISHVHALIGAIAACCPAYVFRLVNLTNVEEYDNDHKMQASVDAVCSANSVILFSNYYFGDSPAKNASFHVTCRAASTKLSDMKVVQNPIWNTPQGVLTTSFDPAKRLNALKAISDDFKDAKQKGAADDFLSFFLDGMVNIGLIRPPPVPQTFFRKKIPTFPMLLCRFGIKMKKVTGPRVATALLKIADNHALGAQVAFKVALQFMEWSDYHHRRFQCKDFLNAVGTIYAISQNRSGRNKRHHAALSRS